MNPVFNQFNQTVINPLALFFTIIACICILSLKREYMMIPALLIAMFTTTMQRIVIFGIDFPLLRIILLFAFLRMFLNLHNTSMRFNIIDKLIISWMSIKIVLVTFLWSTTGAFIFMLGNSFDTIGAYFVVRWVIKDFRDYDIIIKTIILACIPFALFMIIEQATQGWNFFSILGGVPERSFIRAGKLRAQGAFAHAILAGTFGATLLPLSWGIWHRGKKHIALVGIIISFIITFASSSSGPIITLALGIFGCFFWLLNSHTKIIRNLFFLMIIFLHMVMSAPVWHLISRIDLTGGSTGGHRFRLIDAAVNNFFEWFLVGIKSTAHWGWGLVDVTNQYIAEGIGGGILSLILFIVIIAKCFQTIGKSRVRFSARQDMQKYIWSLGVVLFAHVVSFISVSYFGQIVFFYYLLIGMISSLNNVEAV